MAKKKVYLTAEALRELAGFVEQQQEMLGKRQVAYIDEVKLTLMDDGAYALQGQPVDVKLAFMPDDLGGLLPDEYVIVIEV